MFVHIRNTTCNHNLLMVNNNAHQSIYKKQRTDKNKLFYTDALIEGYGKDNYTCKKIIKI